MKKKLIKKIAVFLDRDGVINKEVGVINKFDQCHLLILCGMK